MPVKVEQINEYLFSDTVQSQKNKVAVIKKPRSKVKVKVISERYALIFFTRITESPYERI